MRLSALPFMLLLLAAPILTGAQPAIPRDDGLIALYDFSSEGEAALSDASGVDAPLDLAPGLDAGALRWGDLATGEVTPADPVRLLQSLEPAAGISTAIRASNQFTVEAWLQPDAVNQSGPARIVTLSAGTGIRDRNFTLGQEGGAYVVRLRLSDQGGADFSVLEWPTRVNVASTDGSLQHVVVTYVDCPHCEARQLRMYVDGIRVRQEYVDGDLRNWSPEYLLTLGNESTADRAWTGIVWKVAFLDRALTTEEIEARYAAGE